MNRQGWRLEPEGAMRAASKILLRTSFGTGSPLNVLTLLLVRITSLKSTFDALE
jgi:hypothetical protein